MYDNVTTPMKNDSKEAWLFAYLDKEARFAYHSQFMVGMSLNTEAKHCATIWSLLADRCAEMVDPNQFIRMENDALLDKKNLVNLLSFVDEL